MDARPPADALADLVAGEVPVVVTGASGWLGRATLEVVERAGPGALDRVHAFASRPRRLELRSGATVDAHPIGELVERLPVGAVLLHLAFVTPAAGADDHVATNRWLTDVAVDAVRTGRCRGVLFASSGAAARPTGARRAYGTLKREAEERLGEACDEAGVPLFAARIYALSGPYVTDTAAYALPSFVLDGLAGRPVRVRAAHPIVRSYASATDVTTVALAELLAPTPGRPSVLDATGPPVELRDLAAIVAAELGVEVDAVEPAGPEDRYVGDGRTFAELAASHGLTVAPLAEQVRETADWLRINPATPSRAATPPPTAR